MQKINSTASANTKYGIWTIDSESGQAYCSVCRERPLSITATDGDVFTVLPNFCPHCGARMDGETAL